MSNQDHKDKQFNARLTPEEIAILDAERTRLGLRHRADVIRLWIGAVRQRRAAIQAETGTDAVTTQEYSEADA